jgi:hypothetical protein
MRPGAAGRQPTSRIDRVESQGFGYEVPNLGLPAHGAAGVGNWVHQKGSKVKASRYALRIRTDDGLCGEYVTHWVGTPAAMARSLMLAPYLLSRSGHYDAIWTAFDRITPDFSDHERQRLFHDSPTQFHHLGVIARAGAPHS